MGRIIDFQTKEERLEDIVTNDSSEVTNVVRSTMTLADTELSQLVMRYFELSNKKAKYSKIFLFKLFGFKSILKDICDELDWCSQLISSKVKDMYTFKDIKLAK